MYERVIAKKVLDTSIKCSGCGTSYRIMPDVCLLCSLGFPTQEQMEKLAKKICDRITRRLFYD